MEGLTESEGSLNAVVKEYLEMLEYTKTLQAFEEEVTEKLKPMFESELPPREDQSQSKVQNAMLEAFSSGNCQGFFRLWNKHLPEDIYQHDNECRRLEFKLSLYFAIFPFFENAEDLGCNTAPEMSMKIFKNYLETRGQGLSQTTEFVVYYALPFVPNPREHPSFKVLFEPTWTQELQQNLDSFLSVTFYTKPFPYLYRLYSGAAERTAQDKQQSVAQLNALQQQANLLELRASQYLKKYTKIQEDYHNLIGIAAELVDSLENTVRGNMVSPDYLQGVCERLFNTSQNNPTDSVDFTRPGTAASVIRASLVNASVGNSVASDVLYYPSLNFDKLKTDLAQVEVRKKALLLQALRWRLTKSQAGDQMDAVISSYIANDILGCSLDPRHLGTVIDMLHSSEDLVREYMARLLNTLASFTQGRTYISESRVVVTEMFNSLKEEEKASITSENLLGAMQKVSMRREVQTMMIDNGLVEWLLTSLEELDNISDYSLEYSVALLMNLCLRSAGKRACLSRAERTLKLLTDLMAHENQEIRPYLNGALYSILGLPTIRQKAIAMGLEEILRCFIQNDQPEMNRQIQFIMKKISTDDPDESDDPVSDDEEEDDEDEEGDAIDPELDKGEPLVAKKGELHGEQLLTEEYLAVLSSGNGTNGKGKRKPFASALALSKDLDKPMTRPVTPGSRFNLSSIREDSTGPETVRPASKGSDIERPRTQSSRPASRRTDVSQQPKPASASRPLSGSSRPKEESSTVNVKNYTDVFASRPKIPRSPDTASKTSRPGSARAGSSARPGTASPPPPTKSGSPTLARPLSKGNSARNSPAQSQHSKGRKTPLSKN